MYNSGNSSKNVSGTNIIDGTVETADLADDAVTVAKLDNAINTDIATGVTGNTTANDALPKAGGTMTGDIVGLAGSGAALTGLVLDTTAWIPLAYNGTWVDYSVNFRSAYRKVGDVVYVHIMAKSGGASHIATLPVGYRPGDGLHIYGMNAQLSAATTADCSINGSTGVIGVNTFDAAWTSATFSFVVG
jgi:hypothetical protein